MYKHDTTYVTNRSYGILCLMIALFERWFFLHNWPMHVGCECRMMNMIYLIYLHAWLEYMDIYIYIGLVWWTCALGPDCIIRLTWICRLGHVLDNWQYYWTWTYMTEWIGTKRTEQYKHEWPNKKRIWHEVYGMIWMVWKEIWIAWTE